MASKKSPPLRVAIVGASTLKGREVKAALQDRKFPIKKLVLLDSDEDLGRLSEFDGEPVVSMAIAESSFEFLDVVFFAGSAETTRTFAHLAKSNDFLLVDLTHAFSAASAVPVFFEGEETQWELAMQKRAVSSPHPAAIAIGSILRPLCQRHLIQRCVVSVFEPVSERGTAGVEELRQQTIDLFSFHSGSQAVFDRQIAFNLLSRLGAEAKERLTDVEQTIATHLKALLPETSPFPSFTLIQAPVFHSHAFSFFVEADPAVTVAELEKSLDSARVTLIHTEDEPPSPVQVAGTDFVQVGGMKRDILNPSGVWFWAVSDNLRVSALNAVSAAEAFYSRILS